MKLVINGEEHKLDVRTLAEVVEFFQLDPALVVTEVDGEIIEQAGWVKTELKDGMKIELVQFVGGG